jgi:hypothetical protein
MLARLLPLPSSRGVKAYKSGRPAINEDFKPDYSCLFDTFQLECIPGSEQECPKPYFGSNDPETCFPKTLIEGDYPFVNGTYLWLCPKGYHNIDEDETGQCYPNSEECEENYIFEKANASNPKDSDSCVEYKLDCELNEANPLCNGEEREDGIMVCDQPDHPGYKFCD